MKLKGILIFNLIGNLFAKKALAANGLVPCGGPNDPCQLCDLFTMMDNIFDFILFDIVPPIATLIFIFGGVYFFTSSSNPSSANKAKSILTTAVIGIIIIYGAWLILNVFFSAIGIAEGEWGTNIKAWFEYPCN